MKLVADESLPLVLAHLHRSTEVDEVLDAEWTGAMPAHRLADVVDGAGFEPVGPGSPPVRLRRRRTLPDTVGPDMAMVICGLNPSLHAADAGIGFVTPSNRFWPAAVEAGLVTTSHDPLAAIADHGIGMTDLVKRATPRAAALTTEEYRAGLARLERLCAWLRPGIVCFVGLAGWRAAVDRVAVAGPQDRALAGTPVYVMPSTSGLNARTSRADLVAHLRAALDYRTSYHS